MSIGSVVRGSIRKYLFSAGSFQHHFIHIPKNGGVSIRRTLELERTISLSEPYHYRYVDIADRVGRHLKFFSVVRNPWSRTASRYVFAQQSARNWPEDDPRRQYLLKASFADYVRDQRILPIPRHPEQPWMGPLSSWFDQLEWLRDENGRVACECLRLEHLERDLSSYLGREVHLIRSNVTEARYDYRAMFTDELVDIVARKFAADIDHFGFSFEGAATRNTIGTRP